MPAPRGPDDFRGVRAIFAGAEKLRERTRLVYKEKFGVTAFEGYGVTETSPVLAVNTPAHHKPGSVGAGLLPRIETRTEPVEGIAGGGRLFVRGPNVMLGYLREDQPRRNPAACRRLAADTGDVVAHRRRGLSSPSRAASSASPRSAARWMSLAAVELAAQELWPDHKHAAVAVPCEERGNRFFLLSECLEATREALIAHFQARGLLAARLTAQGAGRGEVPLLATGKVDYGRVAQALKT